MNQHRPACHDPKGRAGGWAKGGTGNMRHGVGMADHPSVAPHLIFPPLLPPFTLYETLLGRITHSYLSLHELSLAVAAEGSFLGAERGQE